MKKLIFVFLATSLWSNILFAKIITIEEKVTIEVPENFEYLKSDTPGEILEGLLPYIGNDVQSYLVGTSKSIKFTKLYQESPDMAYEPILKKMEKKNFTSEQAQNKYMVREIKKLFKKVGYEGVLWILFGEDKLEDIDNDLYEFVNEIRNMDNNKIKQELNQFKKDFHNNIKNSLGEASQFVKVSNFNIKKNKLNDPMISFLIKYNVQGFSGSIDILGFVKNDKPILLVYECINTCPSDARSLKKIIKPTFDQSLKIERTSSSQNSDIVKQLNQLNDLYKSGVLTKEEFEKAKKKILN